MSTTNITNEVVRMSFEGGDFERKISKSLSALQKLKEHLSFKKVSEETGDQMSAMAKALDTMAHKAESVWDRVTSDIRDKIKDRILGVLHEVQDMTVNQLAKGWDKYAEKTSAVATLVGQGYNMDEVNEQMKLLNRYTDETSYQFNEMVNSIGKFTASGQSLEDANIAMQGIANWAALSGANATKASQAMYQLSQAMGKGALKLDDYKSIQNFGMDTQEFRKHALDAAVTLGTLRKNANDTYTVINDEGKAIDKMTFSLTNFTQNLSDGMWLTSDVMMKVFAEYGSALENINERIDHGLSSTASQAIEDLEKENNGIRDEFKKLLGNLELSEDEIDTALNKWTKIQDVNEEAIQNYLEFNKKATREQAKSALHKEYLDNLAKFAKEFNLTNEEAQNFLKESANWTDTFGLKAYKAAQEARTFRDAIDSVKDAASTQWMNVWEHIFGDYETAKNVWTDFATFLYDTLVDWLNNVNDELDKWVDRGGRRILIEAFKDLGAVITDVREVLGEVGSILFGEFTGNGFVSATYKFKDFTKTFREFVSAIRNAGIIQNVAHAVADVGSTLKSVLETFYYAYRSVFPKTAASINPVIKGLTAISEFIRGAAQGLKYIVKGNLPNIRKFFEGILNLLSGIKAVARTVLKALGIDLESGIFGTGKAVEGLANTVFGFFGKLGDKLTEFSKKMKDSEFLDEVTAKVKVFRDFVINNIWPLLKKALTLLGNLAKAVGGLFIWAGQQVVKLFKKIPWDKFIESLDRLKEKLTPVGEAFKKFGKKFKDAIAGMIDSMTTFNGSSEQSLFQRILGAISAGLKEFKKRMKGAWDSFKEILGEIGKSKAWIAFSNFVKKVFTTIKEVFVNYVKPMLLAIWDVISGPVKKVLNMLKEGQIKELLDLIKQIFSIGVMGKLMQFLVTFREFFINAHLADIIKSISTMFHGISNMFNSLADTAAYAKQAVKAWKNERIANTLFKIIASIALLIGLVFALSFVSPERAKKMGEAFVAVVSATLVIVGLLLTIGHVAKQGKASYFGIAAAFIGIGVAVMLIMKTIKDIGEELTTNPGKTIAGIIAVLGVLIAMWAMVTVLIKTAGKPRRFMDDRMLGIAATIAAIGVAIFLIANTFEKIGKLKSEDFWQALAGVILLITTLSAATWLLNVQKSQKGTMALIGLILVIRLLLVPMLRSISKEKFDLGQALLAVFIPLLALTGYIFLITKMINKKGGTKALLLGLLALVVSIQVISKVLIPALASIQLIGNTISAAIGIFVMMIALIGAFAVFGQMDWTTIVKGASGLALASIAMGIALLAMGEAMKLAGSSEGFLGMGLGMAAVLIAMAGAMALIGQFATPAIIGASAILILAGAIAILTQSIIAFKKYVLGEDIGGDIEGVTRSMGVKPGEVKRGAVQPTSASKKQQIKDSSEVLPGGTITKRRREEAGEEYVEDFTRGMKSTDAMRLQNEASEDLIKNINKGTSSMSAEQMLKDAGIDTTGIYTEGFEDYDALKNLKLGGEDIVDGTVTGIEGLPSIKELQGGADLNVDEYLKQLGLNSDVLAGGGEGVVEDMTAGMTTPNAETFLQGGADAVGNFLNGGADGTSGFGGIDLTSGGNSLLSSLLGGMTSTDIITKAAGGIAKLIVDGIEAAVSTLLVLGDYFWEDFIEPNGNQALKGPAVTLTTPEEAKELEEEQKAIERIAEERNITLEKAKELYLVEKALNGIKKDEYEQSRKDGKSLSDVADDLNSKPDYSNFTLYYNGKPVTKATKDIEKDTSKAGEAVVDGFDDGLGTGFRKLGGQAFYEFEDEFCDDLHFGIHSPSDWAIRMAKFIVEGAGIGIEDNLGLLDDPLYKMQLKIATAVFNTIVAVQYLLDNAGLEMRITPVVDMDNLQYTIGGARFDKEGNYLGNSSYTMSQDVSKSNSKGFIGKANDSSSFYKVMSNKLDLLNSNLSKISPQITIENTYGIDTVVKGINKMTKMNGGVSVIKGRP